MVYEKFYDVYSTKTPVKDFEFELLRKDGSKCFLEMDIFCVLDDQNKPAGFRGIIRDITQKVKAENEKEKLEAKLRNIFAAMTDVILIFDEKGCYLEIAPTNVSPLYQPPQDVHRRGIRSG